MLRKIGSIHRLKHDIFGGLGSATLQIEEIFWKLEE